MQKKTEKAIELVDLGGMVSKLSANADKLGVLAGVLTGIDGGLSSSIDSLQNLLSGNAHMPNLDYVRWWLSTPWFKTAVAAIIGGYAVDELNLPVIGKYGKTIQKAALGYAGGSFLAHTLWQCTHSDQGSDPAAGLRYPGGSGSSGGNSRGYSY